MSIKDLLLLGKKPVPVNREESNSYKASRRDIDSLFNNFFHGFDMEPFGGRISGFIPKVDIRESEKELTVSVELPGLDEKDIDISLSKDAISIRGEKKQTHEDQGKNFYRLERSYGSFSRTIPLPVEVATDKTEAYYKKGVLTVTLPKSAKTVTDTKRISVQHE